MVGISSSPTGSSSRHHGNGSDTLQGCVQSQSKKLTHELSGSMTELQHIRSEPCQHHGLTAVRWHYLTFCQLRFGGRQESSRIPIYETWLVSLMGCLRWVQWWSHNKSWIQDIFSHLHSLHDLYAATATTFLMKFTWLYPRFNEVERGVYWFYLVRLSACPSVDRIVSALYLQQYSLDPFHICTSYQPASEGVSCVIFVSKFKNLKFWRYLKICNFDFVFFWLRIQYDSIVRVIMRRQGVSSECRRSSCSTFYLVSSCMERSSSGQELTHPPIPLRRGRSARI